MKTNTIDSKISVSVPAAVKNLEDQPNKIILLTEKEAFSVSKEEIKKALSDKELKIELKCISDNGMFKKVRNRKTLEDPNLRGKYLEKNGLNF